MTDEKGSQQPPPQEVKVGGIPSDEAVGGLKVLLRSYLSKDHIQAAAFFARQSAAMEEAHGDKSWREVFESRLFAQHRAYVTGTIFAAVAFIEATINELFTDAAEEYQAGLVAQYRSVSVSKRMAELWRERRDQLRSNDHPITLERFQLALEAAGEERFDRGAQPYQDVRLLISLRNRLIHYQPESIGASQHPVEKQLMNKFPRNRLFPGSSGNPFYPDQCLGFGCASWAVRRTLEFADEFYERLGIPSRHEPYRASLKTD